MPARPRSSATRRLSRRAFVARASAVAATGLVSERLAAVLVARQAPAAVAPSAARPQLAQGVAAGDVSAQAAVVWSRADRPAQMWVDYTPTGNWDKAIRVRGPAALEATDFCTQVELGRLRPGQRVLYRVRYQDLGDLRSWSEPVEGSFRTPPVAEGKVRLAWSGDTCGQGWGIDPDQGGMKIYETIRQLEPDLFIHSGDTVYADGPLVPEVQLDDGTLWRNLVTPEKSQVAETLDQFRGNFRYNLLDENLRAFQAQVPLVVQWDDHETTNNWYPDEILDGDARYHEQRCAILAARARRAFGEYFPLRTRGTAPERIYRRLAYGPELDLFVLDLRSYRGANGPNRQTELGPETAWLGAEQAAWLERGLARSTATWKIVASDMPLGLVVPDLPPGTFEACANGDGPPLGRELEIARLLSGLKRRGVQNVVWLTADVHYAAAHHYDPSRAAFGDFNPFWEFVAGPLHAGTFGPNALDNTFGPEVRFLSIPADLKPNRPPSEGRQFFGLVEIEPPSRSLAVSLWNAAGERLYRVELDPAGA